MQSDDERFMAAALGYGRRGLGRTAPNPSVGALVVRDGIVIGRGVTAPGGRPHAEAIALQEAGADARGATLYVTLEPCSHQGRSGPCCEAIVAAGIGRVVYTIDDPNPAVSGSGARYCRAHGLEVVSGLAVDEAARVHRGHVLRVTKGRPLVTLKLAETADGYVAGGPRDQRLAITGAAANGLVHIARAMHDAILVGVETQLADDPLMTVRLPDVAAAPIRIVLDSRFRTSTDSRLIRTAADAAVLIVTSAAADRERGNALRGRPGVSLLAAPVADDGRLDLKAVLHGLAERGLMRIFCEGGPTVAAALIDGGLADEVMIFTAPRPLGRAGVATLSRAARTQLDQRYRLMETKQIGVDRLAHYAAVS